ncbi:MAG: carboxypeptidase-like regulatory domain-containing protein, partial [Ferruginibacter sp.]
MNLSIAAYTPKSFVSIVCTFCLFLLCSNVFAQVATKDSANSGEVKGLVRDSAYNFVLSGATVAIYKDEDSSLLEFSIPNNFGEFSIRSLPVATGLRVIITHVGYKPFLHKFNIPKPELLYDFGNINMFRKSADDHETLDEVVIAAPMRMNGDTLEFNADAFVLDSNATAEDLMRRLPGFTIWGDGDITYNGKKISSILVNGKPFMGGDFSVITQNLPKNSIEKVQVYQQRNNNN